MLGKLRKHSFNSRIELTRDLTCSNHQLSCLVVLWKWRGILVKKEVFYD